MVGGRLRRIVGHQRHLMWLVLFHKAQKIFRRVTLDVEFGRGKLVIDQRPDFRQVGMARMPLVGARMHCQSVRAGRQAPSARGR